MLCPTSRASTACGSSPEPGLWRIRASPEWAKMNVLDGLMSKNWTMTSMPCSSTTFDEVTQPSGDEIVGR
jgi:hypothetical protein